jgi:hypothetical protein
MLDIWEIMIYFRESLELYSYPKRSNWNWELCSLLTLAYRELFPGEKSERDVKLATQPYIGFEWMEPYLHFPICLHGVYKDKLTFNLMPNIIKEISQIFVQCEAT